MVSAQVSQAGMLREPSHSGGFECAGHRAAMTMLCVVSTAMARPQIQNVADGCAAGASPISCRCRICCCKPSNFPLCRPRTRRARACGWTRLCLCSQHALHSRLVSVHDTITTADPERGGRVPASGTGLRRQRRIPVQDAPQHRQSGLRVSPWELCLQRCGDCTLLVALRIRSGQ